MNSQYMSKSHSVSSKSSQNSSLKRVKSVNDDNPQWIIKNQDAHDVSSVIEEVGDSFGSGDDLLKQFEQFGIKIENVEVKDEENDSKLRMEGHHQLPDHYQSVRRLCQFDTALDYSNIAKLNERLQPKTQSRVNRQKTYQKIKYIQQCVRKFRDFHKTIKVQIQTSISKLRQKNQLQIQHYHEAMLNKINSIKEQQWKEKQKLKEEIKNLQIQLNSVTKEKTLLFDTNRVKDEELKSLKSLQVGSQKQAKFRGGQFLFPSQNRLFANQLQLEYKKQSQMMKSLNLEIQGLTKQLEDLKIQNKNLKQKLKDAERKLMERSQIRSSNNEKNLQTYNKFLEKIKNLEDQINEMKKKQEETKNTQISQWKQQIKEQMEEINQFLRICEEKQKKIEMRERQVQRKEKQSKVLSPQRKRKSYDQQKEQFQLGQKRKSNLNQRSPQRSTMTNSLKFRFSTQPSHAFSDKLVRNSQMHSDYFYSQRPSMSGRQEYIDSTNMIRYQQRNNDPISLRLDKISSSIQNELNSLRCKN